MGDAKPLRLMDGKGNKGFDIWAWMLSSFHRVTHSILLVPSIFTDFPSYEPLGRFRPPPSTLRSATPNTNAHLNHTHPQYLFYFQHL
ncbi:hypothetical protein BDQ12DRAFT_682159 [Crucibulum laeve]|uniref:Uncharacterized protein n=1 Tax=Crucibulum laeve TaxID=68775 RepID=A0A5C3M376_9AGAR|nr:hypothetical protein BDQ12DRAFT_682159 [Crucibulum laeve]